jgi:hypothetical protein
VRGALYPAVNCAPAAAAGACPDIETAVSQKPATAATVTPATITSLDRMRIEYLIVGRSPKRRNADTRLARGFANVKTDRVDSTPVDHFNPIF